MKAPRVRIDSQSLEQSLQYNQRKWFEMARPSKVLKRTYFPFTLELHMVYNFIPSWLFDLIFANQSKEFYATANAERTKKQ